jgi:sugar lactone lactonase YvrE
MKVQSAAVRNSLIALWALSSTLYAEAPAYKVVKSFGQNEFKTTPVSVCMAAKDQLLVLLQDGTVVRYDTDGKTTGSFKADMKTSPTTMAVADDKIYLLGTVMTERILEIQGQKIKQMEATGIKCEVFDPAGAKVSEIQLPDARSATDAHFIGKELVVADYTQKCILYYELAGTVGKVTRKIDKVFRLCCGIFDFCPSTDANSIVVANLGAFKVQTYTDGKSVNEFGARGTKEEEFHGCCNPVNVTCLADGSIVTVEKAPTRVKIYDKAGKTEKLIAGLGEMVDGCNQIPIAVDSKGTLYLASTTKNLIVKCAPVTADPAAPATP